MKWKPVFIKELINLEISDNGLLRNKITNKIYKTNYDIHGYERVTIHYLGKSYNLKIHQLVANAFKDKLSDKHIVNHIDGNKKNNNINNLEWVSQSENLSHAIRTGLKKITGINNPAAKCSEEDIRAICKLLKSNPELEYIEIVNKVYPILKDDKELTRKKKLISQIKTKSRWKIISDEYF